MNIDVIKEKLVSRKTKDRKRAAKEIGNAKLTGLADMLYEAYLKEIKDKRTWQTQVEMISALGNLKHMPALAEMELIVNKNIPHDMITSAASTTFVRLTRKSKNDANPIIKLLKIGSVSVIAGALETLARDQMIPSSDEIKQILKLSWDINKHKDRIGYEYGLIDSRIYVAIASANWNIELTAPFLTHCIETAFEINRFDKPVENTNLINVCKNSLKGKYSKGYL
jgi:hypothetical protein